MTWRQSHQLTIIAIILAFLGLVVFGAYYKYKPLPTCFDGRQNGTEAGIDCGGGCVKVCPNEVQALKVLWARPLMINKGEYTVMALIENPNATLGATNIPYAITLLNKVGTKIGERTGVAIANPKEKFLVFESGFTVGQEVPTRAFIDFSAAVDWKIPRVPKPILSIARQSFSTGTTPVLKASITNTSVYALGKVSVPIVVSDEAGNAISGSATFVEGLAPKETKNLTFTWREPFAGVPTFIDFYPQVNNFDIK